MKILLFEKKDYNNNKTILELLKIKSYLGVEKKNGTLKLINIY